MMKDAHDKQATLIQPVENPMTPVNQTPHTYSQPRPCLTKFRVPAKQVKRFGKAAGIGIGHIVAKLARAIFVDGGKIGAGSNRQSQLNHAQRAAGQ
ncbi:hypothetical protein [Erythrobacter sp. SG61-1L]|uniref:hypothetical protein n=1 Tax=Erythrobacter sp. SG61-1L TaxID=1603897 RepID=UPI001F51F63C|nr:hypothetical protein [Erythrobacter sp. SG61-1L]